MRNGAENTHLDVYCFGLLRCGARRRLVGGRTCLARDDVLAPVPNRASPVKLSWGSRQPLSILEGRSGALNPHDRS